MKLLLVADYNDADYVEHVVEITEEKFNKFKPLIDAIENFQPYVRHNSFGGIDHHNWESPRQDLGDLTLYEKYSQFSEDYIDEFIDVFFSGMPNMVEDVFDNSITGYHTIVKLENLKTDEVYIESNYKKMRDRYSQKCMDYEAEKCRIYSYTRPSDGKPLNSIPFNEMTKEEKEMIDSLDTLWMKYV